MRLVTHSTHNWLPNIRRYLDSLAEHWRFETWLLTVGFTAADEFLAAWPRLLSAHVPQVEGAPETTYSLQHGAWLEYVPGQPFDLDIYTDGDIVMQRAPSEDELNLLWRIDYGEVLLAWNSGPTETLAVEAHRLQPREDPEARFGKIIYTRQCYNIGVVAARRETWAQIHALYLTRYADALAVFGGPQRQQWLVCWAIGELGLHPVIAPYAFHAHGCYALPPNVRLEGGELRADGQAVLFSHHL